MGTMSITDAVTESLEARLLGATAIETGIHTLDVVLSLQYRLHYHTLCGGLTSDVARVLKVDCKKLQVALDGSIAIAGDPDAFNVIEKILLNCLSIIAYFEKDPQTSSSLREAHGISVKSSKYKEFCQLLDLENLYYQSLLSDKHIVSPGSLLQCIKDIPSRSKGLFHSYLTKIASNLSKNITLKQLCKEYNYEGPLIWYLYLLSPQSKWTIEDDTYLLSLATTIVNESKFPMASQCNNKHLEQLHFFLQMYFETVTDIDLSRKWEQLIVLSIQRTFQSKNISRSAMAYFGRSTETLQESILNFNNYMKYCDKELELSKETRSTYIDPIEIIDSLTKILTKTTTTSSIKNIFDFEWTADSLQKNLVQLYSKYNLTIIEPKMAQKYLSIGTKLVLPITTSFILVSAWRTLYNIRSNNLDYLITNELPSYLCNAISLAMTHDPKRIGSSLQDLQFQYAYCLAQQRQIEPCINFLENAILESSPTFYKAWHLLALCRSIQEDKEISYKIICSVINAMDQDFEQKHYKKISNEEKWQYINIKITEIYLINEIFGNSDALESIPELLTHYNKLYPGKTGDETVSLSRSPQYLLQSIWLLAAQLYMNDPEHFDDAKGAIREAKKISEKFTNINVAITNGHLLMKLGKFTESFEEFESALHCDSLNVDAIISFAEFVFPNETSTTASEQQLIEYCKLNPYKQEDLKINEQNNDDYEKFFGNDINKSAAFARLKLLIDCSLNKSIDAYYSPEIWWYLSLIHEKYGNKQVTDTLLNCIQNKETAPLRSFKFCNY